MCRRSLFDLLVTLSTAALTLMPEAVTLALRFNLASGCTARAFSIAGLMLRVK